MITEFLEKPNDVERIRDLARIWLSEAKCDQFGLKAFVDDYLQGAVEDICNDKFALIAAKHNNLLVGFMGVRIIKSPICSSQLIANENFFYILPKYRVLGFRLLMIEAKAWAKKKGCSHMVFTASNAASDLHDRVCKIYEGMGMKLFETSYIKEI